MLVDIEITKADVYDYLRKFADDQACGRSGYSTVCPLANCLNAKYGVEGVDVEEEWIGYQGEVFELPDWARSFVYKIDCLQGLDGSQVPASKAREILEEID